jgi:hypothetical protein
MKSCSLASLVVLLPMLACGPGCASRTEPAYQSYLGRVAPGTPPPPPSRRSESREGPGRPAEVHPVAFAESPAVSVREIHLSLQDPVDERSRIQLLSISSDSTTKILTPAGQVLSGRPGDYFIRPGDDGSGLQLVTASPKEGDALFEQRTKP